MVADVGVLVVALVAPMLVRNGLSWPARPGNYLPAYTVVVVVHLAAYYFGGLYEREQRLGNRPMLPWVVSMTFGGFLLVALFELLTQAYYVPRLNFAPFLVIATLGVAGNRRISRRLRLKHEGPPRVLLVGVPDDVNVARAHLLAETGRIAQVVGETNSTRDLLHRVDKNEATDVLLLSTGTLEEVYPEPLTTCERRGIGVHQRISARDTLLGLEGLREIAGMPFVALRPHALPVSRARFKRAFELTGLLLVLPIVVVVGALLTAYVRVVAGKPVLFWQERVGQGGALFRMVKFRTMQLEAEQETGAVLAVVEDPRIIRACRWLRSTRLDELPQLYNVLRGEMSIVGPRPERPELTSHFEQLIAGYARRHEIPPGMTGLAQIKGRYHTDPAYKLGHDLHYLVNWSPVLDLQILLRTVWVVLARKL